MLTSQLHPISNPAGAQPLLDYSTCSVCCPLPHCLVNAATLLTPATSGCDIYPVKTIVQSVLYNILLQLQCIKLVCWDSLPSQQQAIGWQSTPSCPIHTNRARVLPRGMHSSRWLVQAVSNISCNASIKSNPAPAYSQQPSDDVMPVLCTSKRCRRKQPTLCDFGKATATIREPAL